MPINNDLIRIKQLYDLLEEIETGSVRFAFLTSQQLVTCRLEIEHEIRYREEGVLAALRLKKVGG